MSKALLIVFVKNREVGQVKTRLAKTIGNYGACEVYSELVKLTETITTELNCHRHIYFSKAIEEDIWPRDKKFVQMGTDLGQRMCNAFSHGFDLGYDKIILIGSDLPDLNDSILYKALSELDYNDIVLGPADDGGYYLVGMKALIPEIFDNKPWSESNLLQVTLQQLKNLHYSFYTLEPLNDIDTYEDLIQSQFYKSNVKLQEKIETLND